MHKERIFFCIERQSSGDFVGEQEALSAASLCRFFLALCSYSHPSIPLSSFCVHRRDRGGERSAACSYGTRVPAREGRSARAASELPGLSLAGQGPPASPDPSFSLCSLSGVAFVFSPVRSGPSPRRFLLRLAEPSAGSACRTSAVCCAEACPPPAPAFFSPGCP